MREHVATWSQTWAKHKALIGYLVLVSLVFVLVEVHQERDQHAINRQQRIACTNANRIATNQRLVLTNLIQLQIAALASPYLKLEARRQLPRLQDALAAITPTQIEEACE